MPEKKSIKLKKYRLTSRYGFNRGSYSKISGLDSDAGRFSVSGGKLPMIGTIPAD
jgi:hypothetical protein